MTVSTKPYLIRAIYEWCVDQGFTPHIAVVIDANVVVPPGYDRDGQIVLNLSPDATHQLSIDNEVITFQARFGGKAHSLYVPIGNVIAIYAAQNGQGMAFEPELATVGDGGPAEQGEHVGPVEAVDASSATDNVSDAAVPGPEDDAPPPRRGHLKVVK